ncbi:MAG: penicillin-binding transpeptidase domain-containing protein [Romboutsia sp.]
MEDKKKDDRLNIIRNIILIVFTIITIKIIYMTTFKYEYYTTLAENKTYKELPIKAPRGEIRDKYGRLLAGNKNLFTIQVSGNGINRKNSENKSMANEISLKLINILEKNNEEHIDEFPIYIENGQYYYTFDKKISEFKTENEIPQELNAKETFYYLVDKLVADEVLSIEDKRLEASKLQGKLNEHGYYPPILISKWIFTEERNKRDWLESYKIKDIKISAKNAFKEIRNSKSYQIDKTMSDLDARKIMVVRDLIKSQGYSQYNPVTIAKDISQATISQIEENAMELPGVSVAVEPVRYYPNGSLGSHVLGHMGKMSSDEEEIYLKEKEKKYYKGDFIGKTGIEQKYEDKLRGTDGYQTVQVDALGRITQELDVLEPKSGDTVYLSLDRDLQAVAEDALRRTVEVTNKGGTFKSQFGDKSFSKSQPNAKSGAIMAVDIKTGDVLAMASYPDFDPNKFATGISYEDYKDLEPKNKNDLIAPNPLVNLNTHAAFQPGSTFKMVTGMAAIDNGLSPNYAINDPGVIHLGSKTFGDYIWNKSRGNHGYTDLYKAIQESCNIYFATIATGKNWGGGKDPNVKIDADDILEYAKLFGLDDFTGLYGEVGEKRGRVPSKESKLSSTQALLRSALNKEMSNDFQDITKEKNPDEYEKRIEEIVSWAGEEKTPGRVETMERLKKLRVKEDRVEPIADMAVFTYFNFAKWSSADTFNLSIGQGENAYTPAQIVRFTASIANGGKLLELSVVDRSISSNYKSVDIDENSSSKIALNSPEKLKDLTKGMERASSVGTSKGAFENFPINVATKTGTAQKSGKIPTEEEYNYLLSHMGSYGVSSDEAVKLSNDMKLERESELTEEKIKEIKIQLEKNDLEESERTKLEEQLKDGVSVKLEDSDKVNAIYLRKAIKELNPKLSDEQIDRYKPEYGDFAWSVGFAPADNPEIAVVSVIPQGNESIYALLPMREIMGTYFGLTKSDDKEKADDKNKSEKEENKNENSVSSHQNINFAPQMKK